jgi:septum formation protein
MEELSIPYQVLAVSVEEVVAATPRETVQENATRKLFEALKLADRGSLVIAADTVLEAKGQLLGKPGDETTAMRYLQTLSGGSATAYSAVAVAVAGAGEGCLATETAKVHFKVLSPEVIRWYLSTGEPMGRAGAFGIGQIGEVLTESVDGGYSCVSGLPKTALLLALASVTWASRPWIQDHGQDARATVGGQIPESLRSVSASLGGTRVQLRTLAIPVGHEVDHRHDDQREQC